MGSLLTISLVIIFIVPKVEQYTQRSAIEFYKACAQRGYYVETIGYKSYASLFYGQLKQKDINDPDFNEYLKKRIPEIEAEGKNAFLYNALLFSNWLEFDKIKRPACFSAKITEVENVKKYYPELKEIYRQNGFVFYYRLPNLNTK
jgi:hypothetical protein